MLHQVSYQELKSLVLQYPYSPNLRYLLLLKSLFDQSKDFDKNQVLASLSSPDRKKLRQLVKQYTRLREMQENYTLSEDFLELKDLSALESRLDELEAEAPITPAKKTEAATPPPPSLNFTLEDFEDVIDEEIEEETDPGFLSDLEDTNAGDDTELTDQLAPSPAAQIPAEESEPVPEDSLKDSAVEESSEQMPAEVTPAMEVEMAPEQSDDAPKPAPAVNIPLEITNEVDTHPAPMPKSSFNTWLKKFKPPEAGILNTDLKDLSLNTKPHNPIEEQEVPDAKQIAEQSVEEDEEIASETLALLLERQKLFAKAISMYEHLKLLYPEKSSLFAAKIEELNKKL